MKEQYESPTVIDYEEGYGATTYGVIVVPIIAVGVYSVGLVLVVSVGIAVPVSVAGPVPESQ